MKAKVAKHIAEKIHEELTGDYLKSLLILHGGDPTDVFGKNNEQIYIDHHTEIVDQVVSHWANIIMEHDHDEVE